MRWLNYQHLFYFWHVASCGSVTEASRRLRLAQPTISAQIKAFEDVLGEKLFERVGRTLKLTEAGQLAFKYSEQIFGLGQEFLEVLDGKIEGGLGELRVGIADVVPKSLAYRLLRPAFSQKPSVMLTCFEDKTERLLADLSIGELDLVIADRPIPPNVKVKAFNHFIGQSSVSLLASAKLASQFKKKFPQSLVQAPFLLPTSESAVRAELDRWFDGLGIVPKCAAAFQDRALMKIAAKDGQGLMPVPSVVAAEVCAEFNLQVVGNISSVKEQLYLISIERKLKNEVVQQICAEGQRHLFK